MGLERQSDARCQDNVELNQALQETVTLSYGAWDALEAVRQLRDAGLEVLDEREAFSPGRFVDIGAVMMYLRITPWQIDGLLVLRGLGGHPRPTLSRRRRSPPGWRRADLGRAVRLPADQ